MKDFAGKIAVITGAGSGIGRALAMCLAERGCVLALADVNQDGVQQTHAQLTATGAKCSIHHVDVTDREAVAKLADTVVSQHGAVHLLVNNAGVTVVDRAESVSYDDFEWVMNTNFWGVVYGTKSFLPYLRLVDEAHIVNISSLFGLMSMPLQSTYNASKFAVRGFTEALKMELAGSSIAVSCVHPGGVKTDIARNSRIRDSAISVSREKLIAEFDKRAITTPQKAAAKIVRGIEKNKRRIVIGIDAKIADWIIRLFPGSYEKFLRLEKKVRRRARERARANT